MMLIREPTSQWRQRHCAFSLVELVIVIVIIGIIAAVAVPRISVAGNNAGDTVLEADLLVLRSAIDMYAAEHGGTYPDKKGKFAKQMTRYTDIDGDDSTTRTATHIFGPYIARMPPLPVGKNQGKTAAIDGNKPGAKNNGGWWYDEDTGEIRANLKNGQKDTNGVRYNRY